MAGRKLNPSTHADKASITLPRGFRAAGVTCGIKASHKPDLAVIAADGPCAAAAVFTRNRFPGAAVIVSKRHVRSGRAQAIVCNSGISNVATGKAGLDNARAMCHAVGHAVGCTPGQVLVCSTGVIGEPLPMDKILPGITEACGELGRGKRVDAAAARAILTTDLVTKQATRTITLDGKTVRLAGICKGSGMIQPNMATMLAFVTTDAAVEPSLLKRVLRDAVNAPASFNRISVDHDTSTSDAVMVLASGAAGNRPLRAESARKDRDALAQAMAALCQDLAMQLVADGEGASKVFRVEVRGAGSARDAAKVGYSVVGSPLVKTAVHGGDPNWGRLVMAAGKSGAKVNPATLRIDVDEGSGRGRVTLIQGGEPIALTAAQRHRLTKIMAGHHITFTLDLGQGSHHDTWLGCDLSRDYIAINADYHT